MNKATRNEIKSLISSKLAKKLGSNGLKLVRKPFFEAIFNKRQILTAAVIHSYYTSFGMSMYEQIGEALAKSRGSFAKRQYKLFGDIDPKTTLLVETMHRNLITGKTEPDALNEIKLIRKSIRQTKPDVKSYKTIDLFVKTKSNSEYYFGITAANNNKEALQGHKRKLLQWVAYRLSQNKNAKIHVVTALPYNPIAPQPYARFESARLFDKTQLLVQEDFWDLIGGQGAYQELLQIFEEVGKEFRKKIDSI